MGVGIGVNGNSASLRICQSLCKGRIGWIASELFRQTLSAVRMPADQTDDFKPLHLFVGAGMTATHIPTTDDDKTNRFFHGLSAKAIILFPLGVPNFSPPQATAIYWTPPTSYKAGVAKAGAGR